MVQIQSSSPSQEENVELIGGSIENNYSLDKHMEEIQEKDKVSLRVAENEVHPNQQKDMELVVRKENDDESTK